MPLAKPLSALRQELREILTEDLAAALVALKELLPEGSDKYNQVLALRARLNDASKEHVIRQTISAEEYLLRVNTIRAGCIDLIGTLEEADFEVGGPAASAKATAAKAAKHGSVLYRVPHLMPLRKPSICTIRVAIDEDAILEDIVFDDNVRLRQRVEVSDMMRAELLDPEGEVFSIRPLSEPEQLVREEGYTQWLFSVTPRVEGEHQLLVKVSMMEYNDRLGKYVPREVSVLETITIVTETLAPADDTPLKATGESFALGPDHTMESFHSVEVPSPVLPQPAPSMRPIPRQPIPRQPIPSGLRAVAFLLIFLLAGGSAAWAFTPPPTRDWWVANLKNDAETYAGYIEKYPESPHLEKAYFKKADKTGALRDLRDYQRVYPEGQFREKVLEKIETLEVKAVESIRQAPAAENITQFVRDFPESERLPEIKQAVGSRAELLPVVENAYVQSIQVQPSAQKVTAYLRDFPQRERLPEVAKAVAAKAEVMREVQPELEDAFLKKMEQSPTAPQAEAFLQQFPVPTQREKFERILEKKPALKKQFLQKMDKAAEEQQAREEAERRRAAEEAAEKARLEELNRRAQNEKDATERVRLEKEAAAEAERQRLDAEARRDTDADGVPDKTDQCPNEKGDAANNGCPVVEPSKDRKSGLTMVSVQGGAFTMGCQDGRDKDCFDAEKPAHTVTLSGFQIGKYEVTQADWFEVMGTKPSDFKNCDDCPVENVSWNDVQEFLKALNKMLPAGQRAYRLPTEAEWEYAARGGHKMPKDISMMTAYAGNNDVGKVAWYSSNSGSKTHPVGTKASNELGLYDMSGNVWEWCNDWYDSSYYKESPSNNPTGPTSGSSRVLRGGSCYFYPQDCRVAFRYFDAPGNRDLDRGFRLARTN